MLATLALIATIVSPLVAIWVHYQSSQKSPQNNVRLIQYTNLDHYKKTILHFLKKYDKVLLVLFFPLPFGYLFPHIVIPIFLISLYVIKNSMRKSHKKTHYIASSLLFVFLGSIGSIIAHRGIVAFYDGFPLCDAMNLKHELCRPGFFNILDMGAWLALMDVV